MHALLLAVVALAACATADLVFDSELPAATQFESSTDGLLTLPTCTAAMFTLYYTPCDSNSLTNAVYYMVCVVPSRL